MTLRQVLGWLAVCFVVWFIVKEPEQAAHAVKGIGGFLTIVATGIGAFFSYL